MYKKLLLILLVMVLAISSVFAVPFKFVFGDLGQHPEILMGFIPTYILAGAGYRGIELIEDDVTELQALLGFGYNQRKVWQDKDSGEVKLVDPIVYDVLETDLILRFVQGFGESTVAGKDLITLTAGYEGKLEVNLDSMVKGQVRKNNTYSTISSLNDYLGGENYSGNIYPDLRGNHTMLANALAFQTKFDIMDDKMTTTDGFVAKFDAKWAPHALNHALSGDADYYSLTLNAVGAKTLFEVESKNGKDLFTITLVDRANVNWTDGSLVPVFAQGPVSLGRKVRGFNTWTYNTQFTAVNNFDIRFAGPNLGVKGIFPRANVFFDIGYGCGNYFNTNYSASNFLMSTGVQLTISFFDFIDLGYQVAYLFNGNKLSEGDSKIVGSFTFFLDF